jgi:GAF domain-containing protein
MQKDKAYQEIQTALKGVLSTSVPWETAMVSLIALVKEKLHYVSWIGFYRSYGENLWVGPYQGRLACLEIPPGKGVCGTAFQQKKTLIVPDVEKFPGHIACDAQAKSEIVVPVFQKGKIIGVLDLDSHQLNAFDHTDQRELEKILTTF